MGNLTKRQQDFIINYVESRNAYQSALKAGYSPAFAKSKAHELLKNPEISEQITHLTEKYFKSEFQALALKSIKELEGVLKDEENRATQLQAIRFILKEAGVTENDTTDSGTIEIKVTLPKELE